ncbi:MAG TPA: hypothetical protein VMW76_06405 [Bacteroidales bacterium]|nr:hypothetical protein [Bacteroidales bacterium]
MKILNQETKFENFNNFLLSDDEMLLVRGGDGEDDGKGTTIPPVTDPEI